MDIKSADFLKQKINELVKKHGVSKDVFYKEIIEKLNSIPEEQMVSMLETLGNSSNNLPFDDEILNRAFIKVSNLSLKVGLKLYIEKKQWYDTYQIMGYSEDKIRKDVIEKIHGTLSKLMNYKDGQYKKFIEDECMEILCEKIYDSDEDSALDIGLMLFPIFIIIVTLPSDAEINNVEEIAKKITERVKNNPSINDIF